MPVEMDEMTRRLWETLADPEVPPEKAAAALLERHFDTDDVALGDDDPARLGWDLARDHGLLRARAVADALLDDDPEHPAGLMFAAGVAKWAGDEPREVVVLLARAAFHSLDPGVHRTYAVALLTAGDHRMLLRLTEWPPTEDVAVFWEDVREEALRRAAGRASLPPEGPCPCDSGATHAACCRPVEERALARDPPSSTAS